MSDLFDTAPFAYVGNNKYYKDLTPEEKEELKNSAKTVKKEELPSSDEVEESSASVIGQMLPQVGLTEDEDPSFDDLMADVDDETKLLNESLEDEINGDDIYYEKSSIIQNIKDKFLKTKNNVVNQVKVLRAAKAYVSMKMASSRLTVALTKDPDIRDTPKHKELEKKVINAEKAYRKLKKDLNDDEISKLNELNASFDKEYKEKMKKTLASIKASKSVKTESVDDVVVEYASDDEYIIDESVAAASAAIIGGTYALIAGLAAYAVGKSIKGNIDIKKCAKYLSMSDDKFIDPKNMTIKRYSVKKLISGLEPKKEINNKLLKLLYKFGSHIDVYNYNGKPVFAYTYSKNTTLGYDTAITEKKIYFNMCDKSMEKFKYFYLAYSCNKCHIKNEEAWNWCAEFLKKQKAEDLKNDDEKKEDVKKESTEDIFIERDIDSDMKPIIEKLNKKGYKTQSSSSGHNNLVAKDDHTKNGVRDGRLYTDARVVFDGKYDLGKAPKYWYWKKVENSDEVDYLDVEETEYDTTPGGPSKAFQDWKIKYMRSLEDWVDELPDISDGKNEEKDEKEEEVEESVIDTDTNLDTLYESVISDLFDIQI